MKEKGAILVPTRFVVDKIIEFGKDKLPPEQFTKALLVAFNHEDAIKLAIRHGVRIALGCFLSRSFRMFVHIQSKRHKPLGLYILYIIFR